MVVPMNGTSYNTSIRRMNEGLRQDGMHLLCISFNLLEHVSIIIFSGARLFALLNRFEARVKALQRDRVPFIERPDILYFIMSFSFRPFYFSSSSLLLIFDDSQL